MPICKKYKKYFKNSAFYGNGNQKLQTKFVLNQTQKVMKKINQSYQKIKISLLFILMSTIIYGQEGKSSGGLQYDYFSITPVEIFFWKDGAGCAAISSNLGFSLNEHLFSLNASTGSEIVIIFGTPSTFYQINLLYGRAFKLSEVVYIDTHAGAGIFGFNDHRDTKLTRIGIPLIAKLRFKTGDRFSLGLKFQANINSIQNSMAVGIVLQWNSIHSK